MEDALVLVGDSTLLSPHPFVLILVVMEDALVHIFALTFMMMLSVCLNPCCNGRCTRTYISLKRERDIF